jgi:hypothetical protein
MKTKLAAIMEWVRPIGISIAIFLAEYLGRDAASKFHILGLSIVILMCGTVAFESLVLGETASAKIGYKPSRPYQVQSGLNNLATALTAVLVWTMNWGRFADAAIVSAMLLFFVLSGGNHAFSAIREHNLKPVNLLRPITALILCAVVLPYMLRALAQ